MDRKVVLIASANSIFRNGIIKIFSKRKDFETYSIFHVADNQELLDKFSTLKPSILVIDYDDINIEKSSFMNSFMELEHNAQLLLVSLQQGGDVVFYDRQILSLDEAHQWLQFPLSGKKTQSNFNNQVEEEG